MPQPPPHLSIGIGSGGGENRRVAAQHTDSPARGTARTLSEPARTYFYEFFGSILLLRSRLMTIKLQCPSCKSEDGLFASPREVKSYDDLIGVTCTNCGHRRRLQRQRSDGGSPSQS